MPLRHLYQRAGELAHSWGNNGLYPAWLKEASLEDPRSVPAHLHSRTVKPPALDMVTPVTRFGLWLLLKDCPKLTNDATLAHFDKSFCKTFFILLDGDLIEHLIPKL